MVLRLCSVRAEQKAAEGEDNEGGGGAGGEATAPGAVAEGVEGDGSTDSDDDCGEDTELAELIASGAVESYYAGPTPRMMLRWRRRGARWWDEFWVDGEQLPDAELEGDVHWEDKYNFCDEVRVCVWHGCEGAVGSRCMHWWAAVS